MPYEKATTQDYIDHAEQLFLVIELARAIAFARNLFGPKVHQVKVIENTRYNDERDLPERFIFAYAQDGKMLPPDLNQPYYTDHLHMTPEHIQVAQKMLDTNKDAYGDAVIREEHIDWYGLLDFTDPESGRDMYDIILTEMLSFSGFPTKLIMDSSDEEAEVTTYFVSEPPPLDIDLYIKR